MARFTHWFDNKKKDWGTNHSQLSMRVGESGEVMKLGQARQVEIYICFFIKTCIKISKHFLHLEI